ncbi:hypothetical protein [Vibrio fluvialis]|uniref:hypothetical protein n=1 Tax=Vibrio fluvialis TaxID=676 RepID=UPI0013026E2A|nr:hypothetical protein [Vibrio fluvialis]EKO3404983.1 hypothetical protein [Vibrio fluvialis]ELS8946666.1 hypothetical protein [Vibrio fluvialis]MCG6384509.1 hypothetical protein [Vibrio fluvialis]
MITSRKFLADHEQNITKEIEAILLHISDNIEKTGRLDVQWTLDFAPYGAAMFIAAKIREQLSEKGWLCQFSLDDPRRLLKFEIYPDLSSVL